MREERREGGKNRGNEGGVGGMREERREGGREE